MGDRNRGLSLIPFTGLPIPPQGIKLIQLWLTGFPGDLPTAIRHSLAGFISQDMGSAPVAFLEKNSLRGSRLGKDHTDFHALHLVADMRGPIAIRCEKSILEAPGDIELVDIALVLHFPQGQKNVGLVARSVSVDGSPPAGLVVDQDLPISPGIILKSDDLILLVAHLHKLAEGSCFASLIQYLEG